MPLVQLEGLAVDVDEDGFIQEPDSWTEELAAAIAKTEDVPELTPDHWKVVTYLRDYYADARRIPSHQRIAEQAAALGLAKVVATEPGDDGLMTGLVQYFASHGNSRSN